MKTKTENPETEIHKCSICKGLYVGWGNNAAPYYGRCCSDCNDMYVIPARIAELYGRKKEPSHD
jgi:hypothetical protein